MYLSISLEARLAYLGSICRKEGLGIHTADRFGVLSACLWRAEHSLPLIINALFYWGKDLSWYWPGPEIRSFVTMFIYFLQGSFPLVKCTSNFPWWMTSETFINIFLLLYSRCGCSPEPIYVTQLIEINLEMLNSCNFFLGGKKNMFYGHRSIVTPWTVTFSPAHINTRTLIIYNSIAILNSIHSTLNHLSKQPFN